MDSAAVDDVSDSRNVFEQYDETTIFKTSVRNRRRIAGILHHLWSVLLIDLVRRKYVGGDCLLFHGRLYARSGRANGSVRHNRRHREQHQVNPAHSHKFPSISINRSYLFPGTYRSGRCTIRILCSSNASGRRSSSASFSIAN